MDDVVAEVKQRTDIVELVGSYLSLKKSGQNFKALCPFHQEKTPSFMVNPERQIYKCFGCGEAGDAFSFLQKMEGLTFPEALEQLASRAGVTLPARRVAPEFAAEQKALKSRLFLLNRQASEFYQAVLTKTPHGEAALKYLKDRGLKSETIALRGLGFAPRERALLMRALMKKGVGEGDLEAAGLIVKDEQGTFRDRFIDRIMIPLKNPIGEIVGFSGRLLTEHPQAPKYLNSPETAVFKKGQYVYGLELAKAAIRKEGQAIFVEGHLDVILGSQAGTQAIVGTGGTAVTREHLQILRRLTDRLLLAFDRDEAGERTTEDVAARALRLGFEVKIVDLSSHKDPAELAAADGVGWLAAVREARPIFEAALLRLRTVMPKLDARARAEVARRILTLIAALPSPVEVETHLKTLAEVLEVSYKAVNDEFHALQREDKREPTDKAGVSERRGQFSLDEILVGLLIRFPALLTTTPKLPLVDEQLLTIVEAARSQSRLAPELLTRRAILDFTVEALYANLDEGEAKREVEAILRRFSETSREAVQVEFANRIREAEKMGDKAKLKVLLEELQQALGARGGKRLS